MDNWERDKSDVRELFYMLAITSVVAVIGGVIGLGLAYFLHAALTLAEIGHYWGGSWIGF